MKNKPVIVELQLEFKETEELKLAMAKELEKLAEKFKGKAEAIIKKTMSDIIAKYIEDKNEKN